MKRKTVIFFFLFLTMTLCYGQKKDTTNLNRIPHNSIYLEIGGNALFYSLNYERKIYSRKWFTLSGRIGTECFPPYPNDGSILLGFPLLINGLFHCYKGLFFELSSGVSFFYHREKDYNYYYSNPTIQNENMVFYSANIGIRYQGKKGFLFRTCLTPFYNFKYSQFNFSSKSDYFTWVGVSLGYSFDRKK